MGPTILIDKHLLTQQLTRQIAFAIAPSFAG